MNRCQRRLIMVVADRHCGGPTRQAAADWPSLIGSDVARSAVRAMFPTQNKDAHDEP